MVVIGLTGTSGSDTGIQRSIGDTLKKRWRVIILLAAAVWTLPWPVVVPKAGLDESWLIGLNMAFLDGLQFGRDVIFTFGPLGFLWQPQALSYPLWLCSLGYNLAVHAAFFASIWLLLKRIQPGWHCYPLIAVLLVFLNPSPDFKVLIAVVLLIYAMLLRDRPGWKDVVALSAIGLLLAAASLVKFNLLIVSVSIVLLTPFSFYLLKKRYRYWACLATSYLLGLLALWVISGQSLMDMGSYLSMGLQITAGYNDAMAVPGIGLQLVSGFVALLPMVAICLAILIGRDPALLALLIPASGILGSAYKHGLTRLDVSHLPGLLQVYGIFFAVLAVVLIGKKTDRFRSVTGSLCAVMAAVVLLCYFVNFGVHPVNFADKAKDYAAALGMIVSPGSFDHKVADYRENVQRTYALDQHTLNLIDNGTVDIMPWDIALAWGYGLKWDPRPVFQSYSDYTPALDQATGRHFSKGTAPDHLLYFFSGIDGRYPLFDEPSTFRAVLENYTYLYGHGDYILLNYTGESRSYTITDLGSAGASLGEPIAVPEYENGTVYGRIAIDHTTYGKLKSLAFKPAGIHISFTLVNGTQTHSYKLIPAVAADGVYLSGYAQSISDMALIFQGKPSDRISAITITTDDPAEFGRNVSVEFFGIPAP